MSTSKNNDFDSLRDNIRNRVNKAVNSVTQAKYPLLDIYQLDGHIVVQTAPLDGLDPTTIDVVMDGDNLTITGTTRTNDTIPSENYLVRERNFGQFSRTLTLSVKVKAHEAKATFKDKVLKITLPLDESD